MAYRRSTRGRSRYSTRSRGSSYRPRRTGGVRRSARRSSDSRVQTVRLVIDTARQVIAPNADGSPALSSAGISRKPRF